MRSEREVAFDDLRDDKSVKDSYARWYFDPGGYGHIYRWCDARDLIGEAAAALAARDRGRVTALADLLRDLHASAGNLR